MTNESIDLAALSAVFLKQLQDEPDCGGVTGVKLVVGTRLGTSERWKIVDWQGEADDEAVEAGLKAVYAKLDGKYEVAA